MTDDDHRDRITDVNDYEPWYDEDDLVDVDVTLPDDQDELVLDLNNDEVTKGLTNGDTRTLLAWAQLFSDRDSPEGALWQALTFYVWVNSDFEGAVDDETRLTLDKWTHRSAPKMAPLRVNEARLQTMDEYALTKELKVYQNHLKQRADSEGFTSRRHSRIATAADRLDEARRLLEHESDVRRRATGDSDPPQWREDREHDRDES